MTLGSRLLYQSEMLLDLLNHQSIFFSYSEHSLVAYFPYVATFFPVRVALDSDYYEKFL